MFATYLAVKAMEEAGHWEYAANEKANLLAGTAQLELGSIANLTVPYPEGTHALAYQIGCRLIEAVGWESLSQLGTMIDEEHAKHDLEKWISGLSAGDQKVVRTILTDLP